MSCVWIQHFRNQKFKFPSLAVQECLQGGEETRGAEACAGLNRTRALRFERCPFSPQLGFPL